MRESEKEKKEKKEKQEQQDEQRFTLTFDEFFKIGMKAFFTEFGFEVQSEVELFKLPKKLDVLLLRQNQATPTEFKLLSYFKKHNLVSYKSPRDRIREKDIRDAVIYLNGYINITKEANYQNTTMSIFCNHKPEKFLKQNKANVVLQASGYWQINYGLFTVHLLNLNQTELDGLEALFLKDFANVETLKVAYRALKQKEHDIENTTNIKIVDMIQQFVYYRAYGLDTSLLKEFKMPSTAEIDITDIVKPHYERGMEQGIQQGRQEGIEYGLERGIEQGIEKGAYKKAIETAKRLKKLNVETKIICKSTGLSKKEVAKL